MKKSPLKIKLFIPVSLSAIILLSCEKTMFVDLPKTEKKLVLNGILSPDYGLWLNVSESLVATSPDNIIFIPVKDATVDYFHGEDLIRSVTENDEGNYYVTDSRPLVNSRYEINVNADGFPQAVASVTIPEPVEIIDFDTACLIRNTNIYNQVRQYEVEFFVNFRFQDPENISNHYMLGVYYWENGATHPLMADTEDPEMNIYIQDGIKVLAWNDRNFDGQDQEFTVKFRMNRYEGFETQYSVTLYSIEEEYFEYLKSYSQNFTVLNDDPLLYEPVRVFSNIEGGYGIIAAVSASTKTFNYIF
jgi:hypothetical protein